MTIPAAVKVGDPVFGWCDQFKKSVVAKNDEAWTAGEIVAADSANGQFAKTSGAKAKGVHGIVAQDKVTSANMGVVYLAPAWAYSKYFTASALKNYSIVETTATAGQWAAKTADGSYSDQVSTIGFAQVMGKAGQGGGGLTNDLTDIAQNDICKLRLIH